MASLKEHLSSKMYANDVPWGTKKNPHSMIRTTKNMKYWKGSTLMFMDLSRHPPLPYTYFFISIADLSRKCWIFFMRKKDETFYKFIEFKALVEKKTTRR